MISVVVSVYNRENTLERFFNSILIQTYRDFELVFIDDGSTDKSLNICQIFKEKHPEFKVIIYHQDNAGLPTARNKGIELSSGEHIVFPDPDDWLEKDYLETLYNLHIKNNTDLEICNYFLNNNYSEHPFSCDIPELLDNYSSKLYCLHPNGVSFYTWNKLFNAKIIKDNQLLFKTDLLSAQDMIFVYKYLCLCKNTSYNKNPVYHYNKPFTLEENLTSRLSTTPQAYLELIKIMEDNNEDSSLINMAKANAFRITMNIYYKYLISDFNNQEVLSNILNVLESTNKAFFNSKHYRSHQKFLGFLAISNKKLFVFFMKNYALIKNIQIRKWVK